MTKPIYLDHAAATPLDPRVFDAMRPFLTSDYANPSSLYTAARTTRAALDAARRTCAQFLGAKPTEIIFTSGGTESDNLAIQGVLRANPGDHWVTTAIEHDAVLNIPGATIVPVKSNGIVDPEAILDAVTDNTVLVSVMMANNEIGTVQPIADLAKALAKLPRKVYLHTDATQAAGYLDLHVDRLKIDLLSLNGSKVYGPKGTGLLYVRQGTPLEPLFQGGGQERGRRSGTENLAGAVGLATALEITAETRTHEAHRLTTLRDDAIRRITDEIPDAILNGHPARRLPNNINFTIPGVEGEGLVLYLDHAGIMASTGSACTTGSLDPSHVLLAIGRTPEAANSSLRLTLGRATTASDIDALIEALPPIVARLRSLQS